MKRVAEVCALSVQVLITLWAAYWLNGSSEPSLTLIAWVLVVLAGTESTRQVWIRLPTKDDGQ